jgi:hypothetical protein
MSICLSLCLFVSCLSICLSVYLSTICLSPTPTGQSPVNKIRKASSCLFVYLYVLQCVSLSLRLSVFLYVCLSISLFLCLSVSPSLHLSVSSLSICLSVLPPGLFVCPIHLSVCPSISMYLSFFLSLTFFAPFQININKVLIKKIENPGREKSQSNGRRCKDQPLVL